MIVDGETYACEACVRGHRVRDCQHHDRPLQPVNKKGRPVSQCQHCRAMRKARSAHVKCGCGKRTPNRMKQKESIEGDKESCYCNYGGRCICAYKKEQPQLDLVPESDFDKDSHSSPRLESGSAVLSSSFLTLDENGCNRAPMHANVAQESGASEYNYEHSLHSTSSLDNGSVNNFPHMNGHEPQGGSLAVHESHQEQGRVTSEIATPIADQGNISSTLQQLGPQLPLLDLSDIGEYPANANFELFGGLPDSDTAHSMFGADLNSASIGWTSYELSAMSSHNQAQNLNGSDSCWLPQQTPGTIATLTWEGVPEVGDFGTPDEVLQHSTASLPVPVPVSYGGLNAAIALPEAELEGPDCLPSATNDQSKLSRWPQ